MKEAVKMKSAHPLPDKTECLGLYEQMVLLRQFELAAQKNYKERRMPGFIHLYVGEEAVGVGVCANLRKEDWITSTHRGHGHALAKGLPARNLMAELYGRAGGCCGGRGGSWGGWSWRRLLALVWMAPDLATSRGQVSRGQECGGYALVGEGGGSFRGACVVRV